MFSVFRNICTPTAAVKIPMPESTVDLSRSVSRGPNSMPIPLPTNIAVTLMKVPVIFPSLLPSTQA